MLRWLFPLIPAAALVLPAAPAVAQPNLDAARRRLLCAQLGNDLTNPLGQIMFQRCLQGGPAATIGRPVGPVPQLVQPSGPLVTPVGPLVRTGHQSRAGDGCRQGFVWREATQGDHVCVDPATRQQAWADNGVARSRVNPVNHDYGPDTCVGGYVWREASPGDHVCVVPGIRAQARADNAASSNRVAQ